MDFSKKNNELKKSYRNAINKTIPLFILFLLVSIIGYAQNGINYKALIKDDLGNVIVNNSIQIKFKILESDAQTNVYEEIHSPTTDANGIIIINIGEGNVVSGIFDTINWENDEHFLNVKINTGSGFVNMGTTQFSSVPYAFHAKKASNVKGLKAIDEGNGVGWRLVGRNADNYDNIGFNAIDLSFVDDPNLGLGATGNYAFSLGHNGTASGEHALAFGNQNYALNDYAMALGNNNNVTGLNSIAIGAINQVSGDYAFAVGLQNEASENYTIALGTNTTASAEYAIAMGSGAEAQGNFSFAFGYESEATGLTAIAMGNDAFATNDSAVALGYGVLASGRHATALGRQTTASGTFSTAMGIHAIASGVGATALGKNTFARSYAETTIGANSTDYNPISSTYFMDSDRLFTVGNGVNELNTRNAMVILKNGNIGIGTSTPLEHLHLAYGRLRIGQETIEDGGTDILAFSSSLVPTIDEGDRLGGPNRKWLDVYAANGTIQTSDRRSKTNIANINYGLAEILKMQPVSFNWKNKNNPDTKLGLIAQDLLTLVPEVVHAHIWKKDEDSGTLTKKELDRLGVYYSDLVPVLIKAIQEQQDIIILQKAELASQGSEIEFLSEDNKNQNSEIKKLSEEISQVQQLFQRINQLESNQKIFLK